MVYITIDHRDVTAFDFVTDIESSTFKQLYPHEVVELLKSHYYSCCRPEQKATLDIVNRRFGIDVKIPLTRFHHEIHVGDKVIVIVEANIRKLVEEEMYTHEELIKSRSFFRLYTIRRLHRVRQLHTARR